MKRPLVVLAMICALAGSATAADGPHNVLLFVADGLRPGMVNEEIAPTISSLWKQGVRFKNTHSMFPTFTTANASAMATGHELGDTGDFSNTIDAGFLVPGAGDSLTPFLESDPVLGDVDEHYSGDYLNQETVMKAARLAGISTATIGKLGPALIFDHTERFGEQTIVIDDMTGRPGGIALNNDIQARLRSAGLDVEAPSRGDNGRAGDFQNAGTLQANATQQDYFLSAATQVVLPLFKERAKPFMLVFWSRDPDGTQHNQGDSLNRLIPGVNGPTSLAAIRNADHDLAQLLATLKSLGLDQTTDVIEGKRHEFRRHPDLQGRGAELSAFGLRCDRPRQWPWPADAGSRRQIRPDCRGHTSLPWECADRRGQGSSESGRGGQRRLRSCVCPGWRS